MVSQRIPQSIVLDGQGIPTSASQAVIDTAMRDAQGPIGRAVLLSCHQALLQDYSALADDELVDSGLTLADVPNPQSLLDLPLRIQCNAIVANAHLYLTQLLRYIANLDESTCSDPQSVAQQIGILGFSTGMFAATVIACSHSIPALMRNATEMFRLAFWLGLRAQGYVARALVASASASSSLTAASSWSLITFGASRDDLQAAVERYLSECPLAPSVHLTAVTNESCISVSGHPDGLNLFRSKYLPSNVVSSRGAAIHTLYHSPELTDVKANVMRDLRRHGVHLPTYCDLKNPLRSTYTGEIISAEEREDGYTLAEELVDMTLIHPVNFDRVIASIRSDCGVSDKAPFSLINLGPGTVLWRSTARALSGLNFTAVDWSSNAAAGQIETHIYPPPTGSASTKEGFAREPIAIVGMAAKFPGAINAGALWEVLEKGINTVSEIPSTRFRVSDYNSGAHGSKRSLKTKFGNFIEDPDVFDNVFFRVSPREARSMDPQQRLLLHTTYHALESAGYVPGATPSFNPDTFGSYVGVATDDYRQNLRNAVDVYYSTGTLQAFLSGKIAYAFGFSGPSIVVDTACSSSMVALYQACRGLVNRDCNAAIAGGVNVIGSPDMYIGLDRAHFLSSTGQCKPWDASADGYCRAEGCGMFVLKRLEDAIAEGDRILGVIRGIEVNQSANADSITQPHIPTQINLFNKLVSGTRIDPQRVNVIEAHGTGTKAGDPTEIQSLRSVFAQKRTPANPLYLTSIKANIGHAEAASGAASLAKLLLMLRNRTIPAVISLKHLNPNIRDLSSDGTCIPTTNVPWNAPQDGGRRIALLNNFGAAGSNVAALLEEAPEQPLAPLASDQACVGAFVVGIACDSEQAAEKQRAAYIQHIETKIHDAQDLADFAYSATARRQSHRYRIATSGSTKDEICDTLRRAQIVHVPDSPGKTVFVFSGQGGQYVGMGKELYRTLPAFAKIVDECHEKLLSWGFPGILGLLSPPEDQPVEEDFRAFQQAVFVLEYALATTWMSWGLTPDAVAGHSLGEYAALVFAGVLGLDDALRLVAGRAQLMGLKCASNETGMLAVKLSPAELQHHITNNGEFNQLSIACYNSYDDGVVAGKITQLERLQAELKSAGRKCARVNVPYGYHTSAMAPILGDITALASRARLHAPKIPIVSNVYGSVVAAGNTEVFNPEYFARHCGEPVKFEQGINDLMGRDDFATVAAWIEIGPHPTTLPMLRSIPATSHHAVYLPTLRKNVNAWQTVCTSLAELYCVSNTVRWRTVFSDLTPTAKLVDLPAYPFAKTRFWVQYEEGSLVVDSNPAPVAASTRYTLLSHSIHLPAHDTSESAIFDTPIATAAALIEGHKVAECGLCPASVFIEMATAAAQITLEHLGRYQDDTVVALSDITFANPLVYSTEVARTIRIELSLHGPDEKHTGSWAVSSYIGDPSKSQPHCSGVFNQSSKAHTSSKLAFVAPMVDHRRTAVLSSRLSETFYTRTAYEIIFSRIVAYSSAYHTMKSVTIDPNGVDAYAVVQLPQDTISGTFVAHPVFMDTLLHAAGFVINCKAGVNEAFICSQVDKVKVLPELLKRDAEYGIYCTIGFVSESLATADAYAFERTESGVTVVASIKRMRFKKLRLSAFKAILSSAASHTGVACKKGVSNAKPASHRVVASVELAQVSNVDQVKEIMATVLGVPAKDLREDEDLERYGLDSLTSIEAQHSLSSSLKAKLPDNFFSTCKTIRDICKFVTPSTTAASEPSGPSSDVTLHEPPSPQPIDSTRDGSLEKVKEIIASVIGVSVEELGDDKDLERLGMDSLMSIEAHHALALALKTTLPQDLFVTCRTVREIQDLVTPPSQPRPAAGSEKVTSQSQTYGTDVNPIELQPANGSSEVPLFLIHDGSGIAHSYARLSSLGRQVWGIHNPKFASGGNWEGGILEQAAHYTSLIKEKLVGTRGCLVGGWSIGGVLAFEVARRLIASGIHVPGVLLIDSPHPTTTTPLSDDVINAAFATDKTSPSRAMELARTQIHFATRSLVEYDPSTSPAKNTRPPKAVMLRSREAFRVKTTDLSSQSDAFLAERSDPATMVAEWESILGYKVPVLDIPGNHFEPFDPRYVGEVSARLVDALGMLL